MTDTIKQYKEFIFIEFFDGNIIPSNTDKIETLYTVLCDDGKFIMIGEEIYAKNQVKRCFKKLIDEIENFILLKTSSEQIKLREILKERKANGFRTSGPEHLREIYISKQPK